ncbi:MAG: hypothetical protein N2323_00545 [candidate division WOR-3 bacterium]|nr:hypothetical protein [candidate division WOR-3 bacterium]MCX7836433.1 hypothetical protein [candidate division WOR-3 bacterium]
MKKTLLLSLIGLFLITIFSGCATVIVSAPHGEKISLLSETDLATFKTTKKVWYALWGLVPLTNNSTAPVIQQYNLESVRVKTKYDVVDYLIGVFLNGIIPTTIMTKTVEIEGNPRK